MLDFPVCSFNAAFRGRQNPINGLYVCLFVHLRRPEVLFSHASHHPLETTGRRAAAVIVGLGLLVYFYLHFVYYCLYSCSLPVYILVNKAVYSDDTRRRYISVFVGRSDQPERDFTDRQQA